VQKAYTITKKQA